jgi:hypothetical protein
MIQLPDKQLFRPDEIAELMRIRSVETVHGWIRPGRSSTSSHREARRGSRGPRSSK